MRLSFDHIASQFDNQRGLPRPAIRAWMEWVDELSAGRRLHIIEPGIGTGRIALPLAVMRHSITGTDISAQMLEQCAASAGGLDVTLARADATNLPVGDQQFDLGIIAQLLYLVPDWPSVLDEFARVVKPGGHVVHLTEPTSESDALALWSATWRTMIEATGYRHTEIAPSDEDVRAEFLRRWPDVEVRSLASWNFGQSVAEATENYADRLRPLYGAIAQDDFDRAVADFLSWAEATFPEPNTRLDGTVTLTAIIASV